MLIKLNTAVARIGWEAEIYLTDEEGKRVESWDRVGNRFWAKVHARRLYARWRTPSLGAAAGCNVLTLVIVILFQAPAWAPLVEAASPCSLPCLWPAGTTSLGGDFNGISPRIPLILIHGARSDEGIWDNLIAMFNAQTSLGQLLRDKYKVYFFSYRSFATALQTTDPRNVEGLGDILGGEITRLDLQDRPLMILAHSQGGLVARSYMQQYAWRNGKDDVLRLTTLGTMHHGTPLADLAQDGCIGSLVGTFGDIPYLKDMWWDNIDRQIYYPGTFIGFLCLPDLSSPHANDFLQCLNWDTGRCPRSLEGGKFEKIYAVGGNASIMVDDPLLSSGAGCLAGLALLDCAANHYPENDGAVPKTSALFDPSPFRIGARLLVSGCDHNQLPRGDCAIAGQPFYPRLLGPFIRLRTDKATYTVGEEIEVTVTTVPAHAGPEQATVIDVAAVHVSDAGVHWLRPDGSLTPIETFVAPSFPVSDMTVTIPWAESTPGRYALAVVFYSRGSPIDYTFVEYEVTEADVPLVGVTVSE